jgi:hypothetical protein
MKLILKFNYLSIIFTFFASPLLDAQEKPKSELQILSEKASSVPFTEPKLVAARFKPMIEILDFSVSEEASLRIYWAQEITRQLLFTVYQTVPESLIQEPEILNIANLLLEKVQANIDPKWTFLEVFMNVTPYGFPVDTSSDPSLSDEEKKAIKDEKIRKHYSDAFAIENLKRFTNGQQTRLRSCREDIIRAIATLRGRGNSNWTKKEFIAQYGKDEECIRIIEEIFE